MAEAGPSSSRFFASTAGAGQSVGSPRADIPLGIPADTSVAAPQKVWEGRLQWEGNGPKLVPLSCSIKAPNHQCNFLNAGEWGANLPLQLVPKVLVGGYGNHFFRESVVVWFSFEEGNPDVEMLTDVFSNGAAGLIKISRHVCNETHVKVIVMIMCQDSRSIVGFVPYDQAGLISRMSTVAQMYLTNLQSQGGAPASAAAPPLPQQQVEPSMTIQLKQGAVEGGGGHGAQYAAYAYEHSMEQQAGVAVAPVSSCDADTGPPPRKRRRVSEGDRYCFWNGLLHWLRPSALGFENTQYYETFSASVTCHVEDMEDLDWSNWPSDLVVQLIRAGYIETLGKQFVKNSMTIFLDAGPIFLSNGLRVEMDQGNVGIVHLRFPGTSENRSCGVKVFVLMFSRERQGYVGFVPYDQLEFEARVRAVIKEQQRVRLVMEEQKEWDNLRSALEECNALPESSDDDDGGDHQPQPGPYDLAGFEFPVESPTVSDSDLSSPSSGFISEDLGAEASPGVVSVDGYEVFSPDDAQA